MKIACPTCSAKYSIADEKVQERLAKIRCRKCGTTIVIDGKATPPTVQAGDAGAVDADMGSPGAASGDAYTVDVGENDQRTMTVAQIVDAYNTGVITADTYVWKDGMGDWVPLADVAEINEALHAAAEAMAAPAAPAFAAAAFAAPAYAAPAPAAQSAGFSAGSFGGGGYGSTGAMRAATNAPATAGADLFGSIDVAGGDSDVTTSVPGGDAAGVSAATGARNESSVLFSLSALTAAQDKPQSKTSKDDSGLIDLAALTSSAGSSSGAGASSVLDFGSAPLALSPLGGAPLTGGTAAPLGMDAMPQQSSNKNGLLIGGGFVLAALLAGLFAFLLKDDPQPVATAPTATIIVTALVPAPTPPEEVAQAAGAGEAEDTGGEAPAASGATAKKAPATYRKRPNSGSTGSAPAESPVSGGEDKKKKAPETKKKKSKCNCAPSDLMCAMKCSAK